MNDDDELNAMETLARAALYIPELARGVAGRVLIEEDMAEIHDGQRTLIAAGWRRDRELEQSAPYERHNIDVGVYWRKFGSETRWIVVTAVSRFGLNAIFTGTRKKPW